MEKNWVGNKVDIHLEDAENDKVVRRSFKGAIQDLTDDQVAAFTQAMDAVNALPVTHTTVVEEYRYDF